MLPLCPLAFRQFEDKLMCKKFKLIWKIITCNFFIYNIFSAGSMDNIPLVYQLTNWMKKFVSWNVIANGLTRVWDYLIDTNPYLATVFSRRGCHSHNKKTVWCCSVQFINKWSPHLNKWRKTKSMVSVTYFLSFCWYMLTICTIPCV